MVAPRHRSRTFRRVKKRTPSGQNVVHFRRRKPSKPACGSCGAKLPGTSSARPAQLRGVPKTERRPERPYGGVLCSKCSRAKMKKKAIELEFE